MTDNTKYRFFRKLKNKYRLVILNDGSYEERIGIKITPLLVLSVLFVVSLILVFTTFILFSFTPLKEYVPGKTKIETHKELLKMATKVDSLVLLLDGRDVYVDNLITILNGGEVMENARSPLKNEVGKMMSLDVSKDDSLDHKILFDIHRKATYQAIKKAMNNDPYIDWLLENQDNIVHKYYQMGLDGKI